MFVAEVTTLHHQDSTFARIGLDFTESQSGVEEARVARRETAGFRTTCSGMGVLAVIFISLLHQAGLDDTNE
jgi:hypothetical protein